jgi:DNA-binding response OmpR family regulator
MPDALRVLVVEDSPDCAESTAVLLRLHGHDVEVAPDGLAAVESAWRRPPDVVLLDIGLPGMSGHEVAQRLHALRLARPPLLVAVTSRGLESDRLASRYANIDLHLVKPVEPDELARLLGQVEALLGSGGAGGLIGPKAGADPGVV